MTYLSVQSDAGRFAKWLGTNLIAYVSGAVIFGVGFLVYATAYVYLVPKPAVIPTEHPSQPISTVPKTAPPPLEFQTPSTDVGGLVAGMKPLELPVPLAKLSNSDLIGKKLFSPQGIFFGYIVSVNRDAKGEIEALGLKQSRNTEPGAPVIQVKIAPPSQPRP
jgi:hypothetical protein